MNAQDITAAEVEAKRFLKRLETWKQASEKAGGYHCPVESGALRRSSLDLTRALAKMRKTPRYDAG